MSNTLSIADVERDTGLSKDTLRVWERRYGFPRPRRDALGERAYPAAQVEKLRLIKRLLDAGHRPGGLVARTLGELQSLSRVEAPRVADTSPDDEAATLLALLQRHDVTALRRALAMAEARHGLRGFVVRVVAPFVTSVGDAWMRGELHIHEEHLFTECVQRALRSALDALPADAGSPRVLLATLPGEPHGLGLLMAEAILSLEGCACVSLGVQVPPDDLVAGTSLWEADIVGLSASGWSRRNALLASLGQLRARLPADVALWVGGSAPALDRSLLDGVVRVATLDAIGEAVRRWRETRDDRGQALR